MVRAPASGGGGGVSFRRVAFQPNIMLLPTFVTRGSLVGTVPYMMFEPAQANKAGASDAISLGLRGE